MKSFEARTADGELKRAAEIYFLYEKDRFPEGLSVLTDLDSTEPCFCGREVTCSYLPGADLLRPFSFARMAALFCGAENQNKRLSRTKEGFFLDGQALRLTPLEENILSLLQGAKEPLSAKVIAEMLTQERASNKIEVYISYLRKKTDLPGKPRLILTVRGKGYRIEDE